MGDDTLHPDNLRPRIVCLCGSTSFYEEFQKANYTETMAGRIVLSVGFFVHSSDTVHHENLGCTFKQKKALDELHKRKIDLADEVFVLNVGGYVGESTRSEVEYAIAYDKPIRWLEKKGKRCDDEFDGTQCCLDEGHDVPHRAGDCEWGDCPRYTE